MKRRTVLKTITALGGSLIGVLGGVLGGPVAAQASQRASQPKRGQYLEHLSWKEAETAFKTAPALLLPIGARTKEHGLHLPLNNDWVMAEYFTRRVLDELPVLALPTVQYGYYPAFVEYPGSVSIGKETFRDVILDICRSICRHGPKKIYVLNTGISTYKALEPARQKLAQEGITMDYLLITEATAEVEKKIRKQPEGTHADEIETSMMLYLAPEIVRMKLAQRDIHPDRPGPLTRDQNAKEGLYSPTGAWGDPTLATRDKGKAVTEAVVAHLVKKITGLTADGYVPVAPRSAHL